MDTQFPMFLPPHRQLYQYSTAYYTQRDCRTTAPRSLSNPKKTNPGKMQASKQSSFVRFRALRCNFRRVTIALLHIITKYPTRFDDALIPPITYQSSPPSLYCSFYSRANPHGTGRLFVFSLLAWSLGNNRFFPFTPSPSVLCYISFRVVWGGRFQIHIDM
jgi:hypothetical protein